MLGRAARPVPTRSDRRERGRNPAVGWLGSSRADSSPSMSPVAHDQSTHDDHCARERERETQQGCARALVVFRFLSAAAVCELPGRPAVAVAFRDALPTQKALQGGRPVTCTLMCVELVGFGLTIIGRRRRVGTDGWKSGEGG
jgi:hypothetical protein